MQSRRNFIKTGALAASVLGTATARAAGLPPVLQPARAIVATAFFDERLGPDNGFARALGDHGVTAHLAGTNPTEFWLRLQRETGTVIGLTRPQFLFCLQQLSPASGRALRVHRVIAADQAEALHAPGAGAAADPAGAQRARQLAAIALDAMTAQDPATATPAARLAAHVSAHRADELILWVSSRAVPA